jgi:hypothetical protein
MEFWLDDLVGQGSTGIAGVEGRLTSHSAGWFRAFFVPVTSVPTALLTPTVLASLGRSMP